MRYRKKPVIVNVWQWNGSHLNMPSWVSDSVIIDGIELYIQTLEGEMRADLNDYIIQGVEGELYPCKPGIFEQTYEKVEE